MGGSSGVGAPEGPALQEPAPQEAATQPPAGQDPAGQDPATQSSATQSSANQDFDPDVAWKLSPDVALRPESFGALAYHFGNRKLSFLKTPGLVEVVQQLAEHPTARSAVHALREGDRASYLKALASLASTEMIVPA